MICDQPEIKQVVDYIGARSGKAKAKKPEKRWQQTCPYRNDGPQSSAGIPGRFSPTGGRERRDIVALRRRLCDNFGLGKSSISSGEATAAGDHERLTRIGPYRKVDRHISDIVVSIGTECGDKPIRLIFTGEIRSAHCQKRGDATDPLG